jgi:regulatory protein
MWQQMPEAQNALKQLETRALALLARREYTRVELIQRLARPRVEFVSGRARSRAEKARSEAIQLARAQAEFDGDDDFEGVSLETDSLSASTAPEPISPEHIDALMDKLEAQGYLSDARAAEAIVNARKGQRGILRITQELEQKGVSPETVQESLAELKKDQIKIAAEVWRKKFAGLPLDANERGKQTRFLASRGFSFEVIRDVLAGAGSSEDKE